MKNVQPYQVFRRDFDAMLQHGERQERVDPANVGEESLLRDMHAYFDNEILPLIVDHDWVFEAASRFASDYAMDCFHSLELTNKEVHDAQKRLRKLKKQVKEFVERARRQGAVDSSGKPHLTKASGFIDLIDLDRLPSSMKREALALHDKVEHNEILHLRVALRGIREEYTTTLPRIMFVALRAMKVRLGQRPKSGDDTLRDISDYLTWYESNLAEDHPLYPVLGELRAFYKVARNVESHHHALVWHSETNTVELSDDNDTVRMSVREFMQKFRHIVYLCELGLRGILSAFCERERGPVAESLRKAYDKTFPDDFPQGEACQ